MKVLVLSWEYHPNIIGGMGIHVTELVSELAKLGVEVFVVTMGDRETPSSEEKGNLHVYRIPHEIHVGDFYSNVRQANSRMADLVQSHWEQWGGFDIVHVHDWLTSFVGIALKHKYKVPLIATIHATEKGRMRGYLESPMSKMIHEAEWRLTFEAWRIIVCSTFMRDFVAQDFGLPLEKIDVIPNGIDTSFIEKYQREELDLFRYMYAPPGTKLIFSIGRMVHEKGFHVLVEAVPSVLEKHPETKFVISGKGEKLEELRSLAWDIGVENNVVFTGYIEESDKHKLYLSADLSVFPSLYEPFGIVALEAMAAQTPVVASRVGGLVEFISHGETGFLVPPGDSRELARTIDFVLSNEKIASAVAEQAHRMVSRRYTWSGIARETAKVYQRVVEERSKVRW